MATHDRQCRVRPAALLIAVSIVLYWPLSWAQGRTAVDAPKPAQIMPLAPHELLLDVEAVQEGYVTVGARGHVLVSDDGVEWTQSAVPVRATLTAVDFVDADYGWAVGHAATIIATEDGGRTWTLQNYQPELETPFLDVIFFDRDRGFAIGAYDLFYKTEDGGETWVEYEPQLSMGGWHLNAITELEDGTLVIAGETGLLSRSTDGGETWQLIDAPYSGTFFGVQRIGSNGVLLFGLRGHAFLIDDIATVPVLPSDTDLSYRFELPAEAEPDETAQAGAEDREAALARAERRVVEERAAESGWQVVGNDESVLSLFGATATEDGGYVLVGVNGVIWESGNLDPQARRLPNPREGALSDVVETPEGNLVIVGESGAFLYRRNR